MSADHGLGRILGAGGDPSRCEEPTDSSESSTVVGDGVRVRLGSGARRLLSTHPKTRNGRNCPIRDLARNARIPARNEHLSTRCFHALRRQTKRLSQRMAYRHRDRDRDSHRRSLVVGGDARGHPLKKNVFCGWIWLRQQKEPRRRNNSWPCRQCCWFGCSCRTYSFSCWCITFLAGFVARLSPGSRVAVR